MECSCKPFVDADGVAGDIEFCPLHAAAPELLAALKYLLELGADDDRRIAAEAAIANAEGRESFNDAYRRSIIEHVGESEEPKRLSVEEASRRSGVPVALLTEVRDTMNRMMNDPTLRARINAMYYAGNISDTKGLDWFLDADVPPVGE